jgi:hypothetical protein
MYLSNYTMTESNNILKDIKYLYGNKEVNNNLDKQLFTIHKQLEKYIS